MLAGRTVEAHKPVDRRTLLPITPVQRPRAAEQVAVPGHGWGPRVVRTRLDDSPGGAAEDRVRLRPAVLVLRDPVLPRRVRVPDAAEDLLGEAAWLAEHGVRELYLVSENSTSYGKDLAGGARTRWPCCCRDWRRAGHRPGAGVLPAARRDPTRRWSSAIATTPGVADYFDLSFQHASEAVLRRMRRFGSTESFLDLIERIRDLAPARRHPHQRDRRLPRRDRGRRGRTGPVPDGGAAGRGRRVRLLRRGRHRGRGPARQAGRGHDRRAGRAGSPRWSRS